MEVRFNLIIIWEMKTESKQTQNYINVYCNCKQKNKTVISHTHRPTHLDGTDSDDNVIDKDFSKTSPIQWVKSLKHPSS